MNIRKEVIQNNKLRKLLLSKEELTEEKNELLREHDEWRKDFTKKLERVKNKINKVQKKVVAQARDINIMVGEFEELRSVEVDGENVIVNVIDKISEFKEEFLKAKALFEEENKK